MFESLTGRSDLWGQSPSSGKVAAVYHWSLSYLSGDLTEQVNHINTYNNVKKFSKLKKGKGKNLF